MLRCKSWFSVIVLVVGLSGMFVAGTAWASPAKKTTIHVLVRTGIEADGMKEAADYYNKNVGSKTGINVVIDEIGRHGYLTRVVTMLLGRSPKYDATFLLSNYVGELASAGVIESLDRYFADKELYPYDKEKVGFLPVSFKSVNYKGEIYAFPFVISTMFLYYRKDLIDNPERLSTWDGFLDLAKQFTKSHNPASPTEFGTVMQGKPGECMPKEWYVYFWSFGGEFFDSNWKPQFNSPAAVEALKYKIDLVRKYKVVPPDVDTYEYMEVLSALATGKVPFAIQWDAAYPDIQKETEGKIANIAIRVTPHKEGVDPAAFTHTWTFPINAYSKHKEETFRFLAWLTSDPEGSLWVAKRMSIPLPTKQVFFNSDVLAVNPQWEFMFNFMEQYGHAEVAIPEWPVIHDTINTFFSLAFAGEITPEAACELVNTKVEDIMKRGGYYK